MVAEWRKRPLGELTDNFDSVRVPVKERDRIVGPYPYYGASGVVDHVNKSLFGGEYLLIAEDGENLRTRNTPVAFFATGKFWVNNHAHIVRGNTQADTRFLMYALAATDVSGYLTGSTMPKVTHGSMNRIPILAPPLIEQQAIVGILGALDDKIELNRQRNRTPEAIPRAIFQSWFVDFDPVTAKVAGRAPAGLSPAVTALFPDAFEDSELGPTPKGWRVGSVRDMVELSRESVVPGETTEEVFDHYSIPAFDAGQNPAIEVGEAIKSQKFSVTDGCVLVSKLNPKTPRVWIPEPSVERRRIASTEFLVCRSTPKGGIGQSYFCCLSCDSSFIEHLTGRASGTSNSHQRVRPDDFLAYSLPLPPAKLAEAFGDQAQPILDRVLLLKREGRTLATLRDSLLPKLISGALRLPDAERIVGRAT